METEPGGDKLEETTIPGRGKKRPPSPASSPSDDGEDDSSMSTSDDDRWEFSDEDEEEEEENDEEDDQGMGPFTVDSFPRFSSDHFEQTDTIYRYPGIHLRGPAPLCLFCAYKDYPVGVTKGRHWFGSLYQLYDESEIRDKIELLRNYVYRRGIDNCEAVSVKRKTGMARLTLTSPARGICISSHALFEFELCVRTEDPSEDEPKGDVLIKGCTEISNMFGTESFVKTGRLYGEKCALDVKFAVLNVAVQATVDVEILRAPACGFDLGCVQCTQSWGKAL